MKSEETIEKDQNRQMPGVKKKKKSIKTGSILLLFAVVVFWPQPGDWPSWFIASPPGRVNLRKTGTRWRDFCPARARRRYKRN